MSWGFKLEATSLQVKALFYLARTVEIFFGFLFLWKIGKTHELLIANQNTRATEDLEGHPWLKYGSIRM